jgi:hypothetical protein
VLSAAVYLPITRASARSHTPCKRAIS